MFYQRPIQLIIRIAIDQFSTTLSRDCHKVAIATPPKTIAVVKTKRAVTTSPRNINPPSAAMAGTDNCATLARIAERCLSTLYQRAYPRPDVIAPDAMASAIPFESGYCSGIANNVGMPSKTTITVALAKFPAVS